MTRKEFTIEINASKEAIWDVLWNDRTYPKWTAPFSENSRAETDWKEGSKVLFLSADGSGMVSRIRKKVPNEYLSIEHVGFIKDGVEDTTSTDVKQWIGAQENYTLESKGSLTTLLIEADIAEPYLKTFSEAWPKSLNIVKELAES